MGYVTPRKLEWANSMVSMTKCLGGSGLENTPLQLAWRAACNSSCPCFISVATGEVWKSGKIVMMSGLRKLILPELAVFFCFE